MEAIEDYRRAIHEDNPGMDEQSMMFQAALVMLTGTVAGNKNLSRLSNLTGVPYSRVAQFAKRLRAAEVWTPDGDTYMEVRWDAPDEGTFAFYLDVAIATGKVRRVGPNLYKAVRRGKRQEAPGEQEPARISPCCSAPVVVFKGRGRRNRNRGRLCCEKCGRWCDKACDEVEPENATRGPGNHPPVRSDEGEE
jgi:hypothetical protein